MKIGILGAGQLAKMMIVAGMPMGLDFSVYSPETTATTHALKNSIIGQYNEKDKMDLFLKEVDVVTYENENIPINLIEHISQKVPVFPDANALQHVQDRLYEKQLFDALQIPTNQYCAVSQRHNLLEAADTLGYPFVLKSRRHGYDGKNQWILRSMSEVQQFDFNLCPSGIAEEFIGFEREVSMIAVSTRQQEIKCYALNENQHQDGILIKTEPKMNDVLANQAAEYVARIIRHFNYVGVITVEFFVRKGLLLANEVAPRVHNSGHWTIEGAHTSQFENHLRAILGLPLGATEMYGYSVMLNCIGRLPDRQQALAILGLHYHDYQKEPRAKRKVGHLTLANLNQERLAESLQQANVLYP